MSSSIFDKMRTLIAFCIITLAHGQTLFSGRVTDVLGDTLSWPLASAYARVAGTTVTASISRSSTGDQSSYAVFLDGTKAGTISPGSTTFQTALSSGTHDIVLVKSNEAMYGEATFSGFTVENGRALAVTLPDRKIEIIGDSTSAGYGDLGANAYCQATAANEDSTLAYGYLAAKALSAQINLVAYSGKGLYRNYDYSTDQTMPYLWTLTSPEHDSLWDTAQFTPDVVVVNLGTNDFAHGTDILPEFTSTYLTFLDTLRSAYPDAVLLIALGPLSGDTRDTVMGALQSIIAQTTNGNVNFIDFGVQTVDSAGNGAGCEFHPSIQTQENMSIALQNAIREYTGWS